jgi:uncharacterized membrane protein YedE/YeeE
VFGAAAQQSRFCLRSATVEFWRGNLGPRTAIWLFVFGSALVGTQMLMRQGILNASNVRQLATTGTMSGAILGGLVFGVGMILARGCASRLLVLSATGNLRAFVTGLILTVVAQASLSGALSPVREVMSQLWSIPAEARDLTAYLPAITGPLFGAACLALAAVLAYLHRITLWTAIAAMLAGGAVVFGWWYTATLSAQAFEVVPVQSISFTGPAADTLMVLITRTDVTPDFGLGLVPGVFIGSMIAALATRQFKIETFNNDAPPLLRYIAGACLMGFGGMLAGGCAVGAGITGGSVMALTAWAALFAMWLGAGLADLVFDRSAPALASSVKG